jgi:hypothetical protein
LSSSCWPKPRIGECANEILEARRRSRLSGWGRLCEVFSITSDWKVLLSNVGCIELCGVAVYPGFDLETFMIANECVSSAAVFNIGPDQLAKREGFDQVNPSEKDYRAPLPAPGWRGSALVDPMAHRAVRA